MDEGHGGPDDGLFQTPGYRWLPDSTGMDGGWCVGGQTTGTADGSGEGDNNGEVVVGTGFGGVVQCYESSHAKPD